MENSPQARVVFRRQHHALADDGLAFLLVIIIFHDVQQTVDEDVRRLHHPNRFEYLAPAVNGLFRVAEPQDEEVLLCLVARQTSHRTDAVLECDGVFLSLLGVDMQQPCGNLLLRHFARLLVADAVFHPSACHATELPAERRGLQLRHEPRLAVAGLARYQVQLTDIRERHASALHRVSRRSVRLVEVQQVVVNLSREPLVALKELRYLRRVQLWGVVCIALFVHSSLKIQSVRRGRLSGSYHAVAIVRGLSRLSRRDSNGQR